MEKLKDLCLKQREEIKTLKDAILFSNSTNGPQQLLGDNQGPELQEANQVIPTLQKQVRSLTGQLQSLVEDLAEVTSLTQSSSVAWILISVFFLIFFVI